MIVGWRVQLLQLRRTCDMWIMSTCCLSELVSHKLWLLFCTFTFSLCQLSGLTATPDSNFWPFLSNLLRHSCLQFGRSRTVQDGPGHSQTCKNWCNNLCNKHSCHLVLFLFTTRMGLCDAGCAPASRRWRRPSLPQIPVQAPTPNLWARKSPPCSTRGSWKS